MAPVDSAREYFCMTTSLSHSRRMWSGDVIRKRRFQSNRGGSSQRRAIQELLGTRTAGGNRPTSLPDSRGPYLTFNNSAVQHTSMSAEAGRRSGQSKPYNSAVQHTSMSAEAGRRSGQSKLSSVDKQILKILLEPNSTVSSHMLEERLGLPRSTVQRRRKHLEKEYLEHTYSLNLGNLGFRRVDLLIYTGGGATQAIAKELLKLDEVVYVGRSIGEHTIDLRAEVIVKDNSSSWGFLNW